MILNIELFDKCHLQMTYASGDGPKKREESSCPYGREVTIVGHQLQRALSPFREDKLSHGYNTRPITHLQAYGAAY